MQGSLTLTSSIPLPMGVVATRTLQESKETLISLRSEIAKFWGRRRPRGPAFCDRTSDTVNQIAAATTNHATRAQTYSLAGTRHAYSMKVGTSAYASAQLFGLIYSNCFLTECHAFIHHFVVLPSPARHVDFPP